jgi:tRNA modification GTPase
VDLLAHVEAAIDFPEEDIAPDAGEQLQHRLDDIRQRITALLATAERGRILREGVRVVIYGATNAGKSSLLNRLLGYERAIVSDVPGTTRDTIEEVINLRGIPIRLLDTAGVRESRDRLELAGIERTAQSLARADLILHVVDGSEPKPRGCEQFSTTTAAVLLLLNKNDLPEHSDWSDVAALRISCLTDNGLAGLEDAILQRLGEDKLQAENSLAINVRHRDCLRRALDACDAAAETFRGNHSPEYASGDLRVALAAVVDVIGASSDDAILDSVFAQFCIGK